jgi:hypothetical protein
LKTSRSFVFGRTRLPVHLPPADNWIYVGNNERSWSQEFIHYFESCALLFKVWLLFGFRVGRNSGFATALQIKRLNGYLHGAAVCTEGGGCSCGCGAPDRTGGGPGAVQLREIGRGAVRWWTSQRKVERVATFSNFNLFLINMWGCFELLF